ncbi:MAG TPA: response regulator [Haliangiales bacterium]|nr:response regulator [Haliangiales bacterium]
MPSLTPLDTPSRPINAPPLNSPEKRTLLIVDDEEGPRQSLRIVFKDDYNILLADNGNRAIELVKQNSVDAAVLDIRMSGMSGVELLGRLKEIDPSIEIVMLTAYETIETARQALRLGACDYLTKPFDISTMRTAIVSAMERHTLSEEIRTNNQKLRELQEELHNQKLQEEIIRTKGEIYASVIHDINGPLTIISGFIEIINQHISNATSLEGGSLELVKDRLTRITRQVNNCIEISQRYLSFLRKRSIEKAPVGTNQIMSDLGELLRVHPSAQKNELLIRPLEEDVVAEINGTDLIQILLNLTINALQCSPDPHRVEISGRCLTQPLDVTQFTDGPECRFVNRESLHNVAPLLAISVQDNGPGIPPDLLPRVFEPYFTTKSGSKGTGLGLAIVHRFVKEGRGAIHLQTGVGKGTTFTIYLPARDLSAKK